MSAGEETASCVSIGHLPFGMKLKKEKREQNDWPNIFFKNTTLKTVTALVFNLIHLTLYKSKFHDTCTIKKKKGNGAKILLRYYPNSSLAMAKNKDPHRAYYDWLSDMA